MANYRQDKINDQVSEVLSEIIRTVKDPRISKCFFSILSVDVSKDLSIAKVYYSVYGKEDEAAQGLNSAMGYIRKSLAEKINMRITPKLVFIRDDSAVKGMEIAKILKEINIKDED